jgi:hypothetical protein
MRLFVAVQEVGFWYECEVPECPLWRRYWGISGRDADIAKRPLLTQNGTSFGVWPTA